MRLLQAAPLLLVTVLFYGACRNESTGLVEAQGTGDVSHPEAPREGAADELEQRCGAPRPTELGQQALRRQPYLQQTTPTGTTFVWTALPGAPMAVEISTPEGEPVGTILAGRDSTGDCCGAAQWRAEVGGLTPNTIYCYSLVDPAKGQELFGRAGFRTAPDPAATPSPPVRIAVLGDSGEGRPDQETLVEQITSVPFDLLLHVGDMAYDSGTFEEFEKNFFEFYEDVLVSFPMFPAPGNHEYWTDDAAPYRGVFHLPNNERWYSFDWGDVHFVALDTEKAGEASQQQWLDEDLASNERKWTVAFLHMSPYSSGSHGSEASVQEAFSPIFERHKVDLVLSGHDHHYERVKPQGGVNYIVTGGGGAATYPVEPTEITAFAEEVIHFVYVEVTEGQLVAHAIDGSGREFDQLYIEK